MKPITDLQGYQGTIPYASEMYGVYQPLLGWKAQSAVARLTDAGAAPIIDVLRQLTDAVTPVPSNAKLLYTVVDADPDPPQPTGKQPTNIRFDPVTIKSGALPQNANRSVTVKDAVVKWLQRPNNSVDYFGVTPLDDENHHYTGIDADIPVETPALTLLKTLGAQAEQKGFNSDQSWKEVCTRANIDSILVSAVDVFRLALSYSYDAQYRNIDPRSSNLEGFVAGVVAYQDAFNGMCVFASRVGGAILALCDGGMFDLIRGIYEVTDTVPLLARVENLFKVLDPLEHFNQTENAGQVSLSPVGIVHLYRQYFFELDTFLGPPVQHVWLPPGSSIELFESHSRRTLTERINESSVSTSLRNELSTAGQDDLSESIHNDNESSTKLGVSVNSTTAYTGAPVFTAQIGTSTTFDLNNIAKTAKEAVHKQTRQQSEKVASELRQDYKTTFRTVTETQDLSSKRYLIANPPDAKLLNYELRRKMRQVAVQVQDLGVQLCWQTYVDNPGDGLGLSTLVHIAKPADLSAAPNPNGIPAPESEIRANPVRMDVDWPYENQVGASKFVGVTPPLSLTPPKAGYIYDRTQVIVVAGDKWQFGAQPGTPITVDGEVQYKTVTLGVLTGPGGLETDEHPSFTLEWTAIYRPSASLLKAYNAAVDAAAKASTEAEVRATKEAFYTAARDRIKAAGDVPARPSDELREEERIIVYRNLIRQLLNGIDFDQLPTQAQARTRHVMAEVIESMFEVDKMLYYVAPEWWAPHVTSRQFYQPPEVEGHAAATMSDFQREAVVDWGGARSTRPDNYYITESSTPAKLGSSLGWLLQLDGDNLRNAFLNAPWVKAVIPIRPGKDIAATNWLSNASVEGVEGLDNLFAGAQAEKENLLLALKSYTGWRSEDIDTIANPPRTLQQRYGAIHAEDLTIRDAIRALAIQVKSKAEQATKTVTNADGTSAGYLPTDKVFEKGFDPLAGGFNASAASYDVFDQWIEVLPTDQIAVVEVSYNPKTGRQL